MNVAWTLMCAFIGSLCFVVVGCTSEKSLDVESLAQDAIYQASVCQNKLSELESKIEDLESKVEDLEFRLDVNNIH